MKQNLGNLRGFLLFLLFTSSLHTSPLCDYHFEVSNNTPFVKEGVKVTFFARQKDRSTVMFFELNAEKNNDFELHLIKKQEDKSAYHDTKIIYKYLLYPLKEGEISLKFDFKVSQASDKSMEEFASGNRDVIKPMMTDETKIALTPLQFSVKQVPKQTDLYGDYTLKMNLKNTSLDAYEQLNVTYTIQGKGYPSKIKNLLPPIDGVEMFFEVEESLKGRQVFHYALTTQKDFTLPAVTLKGFSPKNGKTYTLKTAPQEIKVVQQSTKSLLDAEDSLPDTAFNWASLLPIINGLVLFVAGFITAKLNLLEKWRKKMPQENPMHLKIKEVKEAKSLLKLLLSTKNNAYKEEIRALEDIIYHDSKESLKAIKEKLLTR